MLEGIGVFGTGSLARITIAALKSVGLKVVALWGPTQVKAKEIASMFDITFYTDKIDDVLLHQEVDLVCITSPPHLHAQVASKALSIGKHVLCGNPAGLNEHDALKMVEAARYYPLLSLMSHGLRFVPAFMEMKKSIEKGQVGEVNLCDVRVACGSLVKEKFNWMCDENMGGGVLNTIGSHIIDIITFLTGQKAVKVRGMMKTFVTQTERINGIRHITSDDFCCFQMELSNGGCATVTLNTHVPGHFSQEVLIVGSKGRLRVEGADLYGQLSGSKTESLMISDTLRINHQPGGITGSSDLPLPYLKGLFKLIDSVKESFERSQERRDWDHEPVAMAANFEDALYVQYVIDAIRQSSHSGNWERIVIKNKEASENPFLQPGGL
ncbi:glucose-fructose oxidoreductase domain-containing protein 1-like [Anneissia japonica]|uniref:glucose-fructose oxidoreductase domain-containing protein 1-like n=1 Tax=Anneissia japonica TaxID=1529436 RepID=UPI001425AA6C|nr:glucose-fructose oxidoreductase domain-containing protein 1-like [Anneissia japonica]